MTGPDRVSAPTPRIFAAVNRRRGAAASASPVMTMKRPANTTKPKKRTVRPKETPTAIMPRRPTRSLWSVTAGDPDGPRREHPRRRRRWSSQPCSIPATYVAPPPGCLHEPIGSPGECARCSAPNPEHCWLLRALRTPDGPHFLPKSAERCRAIPAIKSLTGHGSSAGSGAAAEA
jgi:hypothetical protein